MGVILNMQSFLYIIQGSIVTLSYALISVILGFILGSLLALCKISHSTTLKYFANAYTSIFRGTPVLIQLIFIYFAVPGFIGYTLPVFVAGIITFSLNSAAYVSEIIRAGIQSIDKGQFEASQALGVSYWQMMWDIIFPQAIRNILPSLINEAANLLKESAIISVIGGADLMRRAQVVAAEEYSYFEPLITAALCYYILVIVFTSLGSILEKKLKTV